MIIFVYSSFVFPEETHERNCHGQGGKTSVCNQGSCILSGKRNNRRFCCFAIEAAWLPGFSAEAYGANSINERLRHCFEFSNLYRDQPIGAGLKLTGLSSDGSLFEVAERPDNKWFAAVQFHPEFKSCPFDPHPLFNAFIDAAFRGKQK
ncbi:MAG: hypothetical protein U9P42_09895 [Candidatus Fermentibacteria bacterium]|nr:hypothetical protein [Candidatus Fermentibacteria bacterium]